MRIQGTEVFLMSSAKKPTARKPAKKMPVAGKSGKDGITAEQCATVSRTPNFRISGEPPVQVPGQFQPH
jgi:hypothetical protein